MDVKHCKELAADFKAAGVPAAHVDGNTPADERKELYAALASGDIKVLTSVGVLTAGFDLPAVSCIIMARPTASLGLWIQMAGRGGRPAPGKEYCLLFDHAGNTQRHGRPEDYVPSDLEQAGKRDNKERDPKEKKSVTCAECHFVMAPGTEECPNCGHVRVIRSNVVTIDGRLVEQDKPDIPPEEHPEYRRRIAQELNGYAMRKGYKRGWAWYAYKHFFKCDPKRDGINLARLAPVEPSPETVRKCVNYMKYQNIKRAKGRR